MCPGVHKNRNLRRDVPIKLSFAQEPRKHISWVGRYML